MRLVRLCALLCVVVLVAMACGGEDDTDATPPEASDGVDVDEAADTQSGGDAGSATTEDTDESGDGPASDDAADSGSDTEFSGDDTDGFCAVARELEADDPFGSLSILDGQNFFAEARHVWDTLGTDPPDEIAPDIDQVRGALDELEAAVEPFDYDVTDPGAQAALEALDFESLDAADARIEAYLETVCGVDIGDDESTDDPAADTPATDAGDDPPAESDDPDAGGSDGTAPDETTPDEAAPDLDDIDPELLESGDTVAILQAVFGVDEDLAECLAAELPGLDLQNPNPAQLTVDVCGTTLLEVLVNAER